MARKSTLTYEQVATVADEMVIQGGKPTSRSVREALGAGSLTTILKFLQQWQGSQVRQSQGLDDTIDPAISRAISNQIATRVQTSTADAMSRLADLQAELETLILENERQSAEIEAQAAEMIVIQDQNATLAGRAQQIESDAARNIADLVSERQAAEAARVSLAKAELRLEAVPRIEAEIVKVSTELLSARTLSAELHEAAAVAAARLEAETALRKSIEVQLLDANSQREEARKNAVATAESLGNERLSLQICQARLEAAVREINAAKEELGKVRAEAKEAREAAAELRGQLAAAHMTATSIGNCSSCSQEKL
jgi:chromosome segregation ATPase